MYDRKVSPGLTDFPKQISRSGGGEKCPRDHWLERSKTYSNSCAEGTRVTRSQGDAKQFVNQVFQKSWKKGWAGPKLLQCSLKEQPGINTKFQMKPEVEAGRLKVQNHP